MNNEKTLLKEIRALEFALIETGLYLDGNQSPEAVTYFEATRQALAVKKKEYESTGRPLIAANGAESGTWLWTQGPWPWECEAN